MGGQKLPLFWMVILFVSVAIDFICLFLKVDNCRKRDGRQNSIDLSEAIFQQASISWGDVGEFVGYLDQVAGPIGEVCFYPDLLFVVKEDGRLADFYLHDKEVPKAMAIFLYRVRVE